MCDKYTVHVHVRLRAGVVACVQHVRACVTHCLTMYSIYNCIPYCFPYIVSPRFSYMVISVHTFSYRFLVDFHIFFQVVLATDLVIIYYLVWACVTAAYAAILHRPSFEDRTT